MTTVRRLQTLWQARRYRRLVQELLESRPEACERVVAWAGEPLAGAMTTLRLAELHQVRTSLANVLHMSLLRTQQPDGGWGDPAVTAVATRATHVLGDRVATSRGTLALRAAQREDGSFAIGLSSRMPGDPLTTAFILRQTVGLETLLAPEGIDAAGKWLDAAPAATDPDARRLWRVIAPRVRQGSVRPHLLAG